MFSFMRSSQEMYLTVCSSSVFSLLFCPVKHLSVSVYLASPRRGHDSLVWSHRQRPNVCFAIYIIYIICDKSVSSTNIDSPARHSLVCLRYTAAAKGSLTER